MTNFHSAPGLQRPTHELMVETVPLGATISIAGHRAGTSPTTVQLLGFTMMTLTIEKPGYQPVTKRVYSKTANDRILVRLTKQ